MREEWRWFALAELVHGEAIAKLLKDGKSYGRFQYICKITAPAWKRIKKRYHGRLLFVLNAKDAVVVLEQYRSPTGLFR